VSLVWAVTLDSAALTSTSDAPGLARARRLDAKTSRSRFSLNVASIESPERGQFGANKA